MELKCDCYEVTDVDVFSIFYLTKITMKLKCDCYEVTDVFNIFYLKCGKGPYCTFTSSSTNSKMKKMYHILYVIQVLECIRHIYSFIFIYPEPSGKGIKF
jgi:uncharacterized pyridoxamine 5'-phosphate oxidase family protein